MRYQHLEFCILESFFHVPEPYGIYYTYIGRIINNVVFNGYGKLYVLNPITRIYEIVYKGYWKNGYCHGYGTLFKHKKLKYSGYWENGIRSKYIISNKD